jgi:hypothetical protein
MISIEWAHSDFAGRDHGFALEEKAQLTPRSNQRCAADDAVVTGREYEPTS